MSQLLIQSYLNQLADLRKVSGTQRESVVREAFKDLLKGWARSHDLVFVPEYEIAAPTKERRYVDGALLHALRMPFGYWEAKDDKDDLDAEIDFKRRRGYPQDNIIFEDSTQAVLIQNRQEVMRCAVDDVTALEKLLTLFFGYARPEVAEFRKAVTQFRTDLPSVLESLRAMIERAHAENPAFRNAAEAFLRHAQETINPNLIDADVREMLIQHILTEEVFSAVFPGRPFQRTTTSRGSSTSSKRRSSPATPSTARSRASSRITPRSAPPRRASKDTTRSRRFSRSSTRISTRFTTSRPRIGLGLSTRPTRSCAS